MSQLYDELTDIQIDALREVGNIGSGNAATALSNMISKPVDIAVPRIRFIDYSVVADELGGSEQMIVGALLTLSDDITGMIMFLLQKDFAHTTLNSLLGSDLNDFSEMDDMSISALTEVANVMAASYVGAISQLTGLKINISVPDITIDMVGSILSVPAIYFSDIGDKVMVVQEGFSADGDNMGNNILMIPNRESLEVLMDRLGLGV